LGFDFRPLAMAGIAVKLPGMKSVVRQILPWLALGLALGSSQVLAKDIRFPAQGVPAYRFVLPDEWSAKDDGKGNLIMALPNRSASMVIYLQTATGDLDEVLRGELSLSKEHAYQRKEPAEISGCKGFTYYSTFRNSKGLNLDVEYTLVRVDARHIGWCTLLLLPGLSKADETAAHLVRNGVRLVTE
jgi:hypothetical protein